MFRKLNDLALKGAVMVMTAAPVLAMAATDPGEAAFDALETKVTTYGGYAFALAVVGTSIWIGIDLFKRGARKGAK